MRAGRPMEWRAGRYVHEHNHSTMLSNHILIVSNHILISGPSNHSLITKGFE